MREQTKPWSTLPPTLEEMSTSELDTARQFQSTAEDALRTGDFEPLVALLAPDVECVTPQHSLQGAEAMIEELSRARPPETLELEFEQAEWKPLGNGRYACELRGLFRSKATGEVSYSRDRSFELTISSGKVSRYEMRFAG
jgi:ketosteroid isomerase-like protein